MTSTSAEYTEIKDTVSCEEVGNHSCAECGRVFLKKRGVQIHMSRVHSSNKEHEKSAELKKKNHICEVCGKYFMTKASLKTHTQNIHK